MMWGLLGGLLWFLLFGWCGQNLAKSKGKDETIGFIVGGVFGPIGLLCILLLS